MNKAILDLIDALASAQEAHELLREIWLYLGPYTEHLSPELRTKLQTYFSFDDSE